MSKFYFWGVKYFCAIFVASGQYIKKFSVLKRRDNVHDFMKICTSSVYTWYGLSRYRMDIYFFLSRCSEEANMF